MKTFLAILLLIAFIYGLYIAVKGIMIAGDWEGKEEDGYDENSYS